MTSPNDEYEAQHTLWLAERDNEQRKVLWRALAAYDMTSSYEEFVEALGLRFGEGSLALYENIHYCYVAAWKKYGWDELQKMIRIGWNGLYRANWRLT